MNVNIDVFEYDDYKRLTKSWVKSQKNKGRGQLRALAEHIGTGTTYISQVFSGERDLTVDQALQISTFIGLTHLEKDYYLLLVQKDRAATHTLKEYLESKIKTLKEKAQNLKDIIQTDLELNDIQKSVFYSDWHYSAIRNLTALPGVHSILSIAERLNLTVELTTQAVDFLLDANLCLIHEGGLKPGPSITHLDSKSPLVKNRQIHWRLKAIEVMNKPSDESLFYTCPMSLSKEAKDKVRKELLLFVKKLMKRVKSSPSEEVACLNIDWFEF